MLTKEQLRILAVFREDLFASLTFKQIKEKSRQKSNNVMQIALKEFKKQKIVVTEQTGDVTTYSLNLENNPTASYLGLINDIEIGNNKKLPKKVLSEIQNRMLKNSPFFILLIFGSYAKGAATAKSDLDIAVIAESDQSKKEIIPRLETVKRREIIAIDYHVFAAKEFLEMLAAEQENVGKQIYRKNIIYYGAIQYYNLIKGLKHGKIS